MACFTGKFRATRYAAGCPKNERLIEPTRHRCDAVKNEAVRKAGYHKVVAGHTTPGELRSVAERLVVAGLAHFLQDSGTYSAFRQVQLIEDCFNR